MPPLFLLQVFWVLSRRGRRRNEEGEKVSMCKGRGQLKWERREDQAVDDMGQPIRGREERKKQRAGRRKVGQSQIWAWAALLYWGHLLFFPSSFLDPILEQSIYFSKFFNTYKMNKNIIKILINVLFRAIAKVRSSRLTHQINKLLGDATLRCLLAIKVRLCCLAFDI